MRAADFVLHRIRPSLIASAVGLLVLASTAAPATAQQADDALALDTWLDWERVADPRIAPTITKAP